MALESPAFFKHNKSPRSQNVGEERRSGLAEFARKSYFGRVIELFCKRHTEEWVRPASVPPLGAGTPPWSPLRQAHHTSSMPVRKTRARRNFATKEGPGSGPPGTTASGRGGGRGTLPRPTSGSQSPGCERGGRIQKILNFQNYFWGNMALESYKKLMNLF